MDISSNYFLEGRNIPKLIEGTIEHEFWWEEQKRRCIEGYSVAGFHISGIMYQALNFNKIKLNELNSDGSRSDRKRLLYRDLRDTDLELDDALKRALKERKGIIVVGPRGFGKSYFANDILLNEYTFFPDSVSVVSAWDTSYSRDFMIKFMDMLTALPSDFAHSRVATDIEKFILSGWKEQNDLGVWEIHGNRSEIHITNHKDKATAANGKRCKWQIFEEGGMFSNLKASFLASSENWKDGNFYFGHPVIIGTGGDMERGKDFQEMFYNPEAFNLIAYEDKETGKAKGLFFPSYETSISEKKKVGFLDYLDSKGIKYPKKTAKAINKNNHILVAQPDLSKQIFEQERARKKELNDKDAYYSLLMNQPFTPEEAFLVKSGNFFPIELLQQQKALILNDKSITAKIKPYAIVETPGGNVTAKMDLNSNLRILEHPDKAAPPGTYIIGYDPVRQAMAAESVSRACFIVYKKFYSFNETGELPVAIYYGREGEDVDSVNEIMFNVARYYDAHVLYENEVPGVFTYAKTYGLLRYLMKQPGFIKDAVKNSKVKRGYGVHMSGPIKTYLELKLRDHLKSYLAKNIYFLDIIDELIGYNTEGNFDRVIALMLIIGQIIEFLRAPQKNETKKIMVFVKVNGIIVKKEIEIDA